MRPQNCDDFIDDYYVMYYKTRKYRSYKNTHKKDILQTLYITVVKYTTSIWYRSIHLELMDGWMDGRGEH